MFLAVMKFFIFQVFLIHPAEYCNYLDVYEAFSSFPLKDSGVIKTKFTHVYYIAFNLHSYFVHYAPEAVKILK